jgi:hypothetical protein
VGFFVGKKRGPYDHLKAGCPFWDEQHWNYVFLLSTNIFSAEKKF